ncbi:MAG: amidase [Pseudomonadota bacterium]
MKFGVITKLLSAGLLASSLVAACAPNPNQDEGRDEQLSVLESAVPEPSGLLAKTLPELVEALAAGETTSSELLRAYLERIGDVDRQYNSILFLNPDAEAQAAASDNRRTAGATLGALDGVPILLKDNIESADPMPTTAGSTALLENITGRDSPLVAGLRAQGAVILGKTNMSQWANFRSSDSMSGWSSLGGQVQNPHAPGRNPCGSSSGSGAAVAAAYAAGAVGTETNGSIICPSNVNGIVGFKPTVGVISSDLIIPISPTQDTAGPMTKTVRGSALMINAMAPGGTDFTSGLTADALSGVKVGVLRFRQGRYAPIVETFDAALADMEKAGAVLVEIESFKPASDTIGDDETILLETEFKDSLNAYLGNLPKGDFPKTLTELIAFNEANSDVELALFNQDIFYASDARTPPTDPDFVALRERLLKATREDGIDALLAEHQVDVLVAPSGPLAPLIDPVNGDVWPSWVGFGSMAAIAGYPHLTVPMGGFRGIPLGVSFIGTAGQDAEILALGYAYEQVSQKRMSPFNSIRDFQLHNQANRPGVLRLRADEAG